MSLGVPIIILFVKKRMRKLVKGNVPSACTSTKSHWVTLSIYWVYTQRWVTISLRIFMSYSSIPFFLPPPPGLLKGIFYRYNFFPCWNAIPLWSSHYSWATRDMIADQWISSTWWMLVHSQVISQRLLINFYEFHIRFNYEYEYEYVSTLDWIECCPITRTSSLFCDRHFPWWSEMQKYPYNTFQMITINLCVYLQLICMKFIMHALFALNAMAYTCFSRTGDVAIPSERHGVSSEFYITAPSGTETTEISSVCSNTSSHEDRGGPGGAPSGGSQSQPPSEYSNIVDTSQQKWVVR